ncbi:hypothetical protein QYE76_047375 [Lolium multiflorum]|uniref:Integrase catalytic domain-containing protein n=1 Tax=Lolium multiflorum TaxID=4521 RepID=A0AAD8TRK5_LOLMU|nr:hypothetical protein QYE76_047375 [Lolium multiflorum]
MWLMTRLVPPCENVLRSKPTGDDDGQHGRAGNNLGLVPWSLGDDANLQYTRPIFDARRATHSTVGSDVWTSPVPSNSGYNYYLVVLDDYSHFVWTFPLRRKSDVAATLTAFFAFVSTQFGRPIHALQTDNGKEFDDITIRSLLAAHGAVFRLTCPYTSSQSGRAERMLRTLNDCVCTLLFHASMPPRF